MARPHTPTIRKRLSAHGVSLVEALVALAVMSIGMLALVGVQSSMRLNSDLAKQRTEATRIASEEIERLRSFVSITAVPGQPGVSYDEIVTRAVDGYQPPDGIGNTTYSVNRNVVDDPNSGQKVVSVRVQWTDRTNQNQTVTLDSSISATAPTLGAMLMVPHRDSPTSRNRGRHASIPDGAQPIVGDPSHSRFEPPGGGGVGWYFNNLSGVMRVCAAGVTDYVTCPLGTLVSGTVRFHISDTQPDGRDAERPLGPVLPLAANPGALTLAYPVGNITGTSCYSVLLDQRVQYYCAVTTSDAFGWGGQLNLVLANGAFSVLASDYKSCRYTTDLPSAENPNTVAIEADPHAEYTLNAEHPRKYCLERPRNTNEAALACTGRRVKVNLINQNFLVIKGNQSCPTELNDDGTPNGQGRDPLVLANTRQHQPAP
jgi:Tfp pilus assembly protein PilV